MPKFVIVGLDHFLQRKHPIAMSEEGQQYEANQKKQFWDAIEHRIKQNEVTLICEECTPDGQSPGCELAGKHGCCHVNITMPVEERERLGIAGDYELDDAEKARAISLFDDYMPKAVQQNIGKHNAVLVLVGDLHCDAMQKKLKDCGDVVEVRALRGFDWYGGPPAESLISGEFMGSWKQAYGDVY